MKNFFKQFNSLSLGGKIRFILQGLVWINQVLVLFGDMPFGNTYTYKIISFILTIVITGITYWYNNDWTSMAKVGTQIYEIIKDGKVTEDEVVDFINSRKNGK